MQTEAKWVVNMRIFLQMGLHALDLAGKFILRQWLLIEDLKTTPGQESSNCSLILHAVVLWRTFFRRFQARYK
jgi:hypothetical protein